MTHRELRAMIVHLSDYQVNRLGQMAAHFLVLKQELAETKPERCPVCGDENAVFIRKGFQNGKQLEAVIEADETYVLESQKGTPVTHRAPRKHGEGATRRGLSNEQLCVCVATDREHHVAARCVNRAKPSSEDLVEALGGHISGHSVILCDGASIYNLLAEKTGCEAEVSWRSDKILESLCRAADGGLHERGAFSGRSGRPGTEKHRSNQTAPDRESGEMLRGTGSLRWVGPSFETIT